MIDLQDKTYCPTLSEIGEHVNNPVFSRFCAEVKIRYDCTEKIEFSACSMEKGWNVKFRKAGKTLCTLYPRESFFTVMVVIGRKEKEAVEAVLPDCTAVLRTIYEQTAEGNGQRWLMIDLEDKDNLYRDLFRLIAIRRAC